MSTRNPITFAIAVNDSKLFEKNFLASPCLRGQEQHQILVQQNFGSAARAYNDAIDRAANDLMVLCHQDILLPDSWLSELEEALDFLAKADPNWGVLGCSGMTRDRRHWRYVYSTGLGVSGEPIAHPEPVQTLDEIVLILRKSSGVRFDDSLPGFHMYGADICLRAAQRGMKSYAISAFCIHNTHQSLILPKEFYDSCRHIKRVWKDCLPIQTTCIAITRFGLPVYRRKLGEFYLRHIRRKECGGTRVEDVQGLLRQLTNISYTPELGER